ncbi:MAG: hypothetical protein WD992_01075 [Candidatus Levyibacteriota bacterium]
MTLAVETRSIKSPWEGEYEKIPPTQIPDYVSNPDIFDGLADDALLKRHQDRSQLHHVLTRERPSGATAESMASIEAHIAQIRTELTIRGLPQEFKPMETNLPSSGHNGIVFEAAGGA